MNKQERKYTILGKSIREIFRGMQLGSTMIVLAFFVGRVDLRDYSFFIIIPLAILALSVFLEWVYDRLF